MTTQSIAGAQLKFTQKAGPLATTPAQTDEPGVITLPDGRKFKVKIQLKLGGPEGAKHDVDVSKFGDEYLLDLALKCVGLYDAATHKAGNPKSFTVHFQQHIPNESLQSSTIGKIFNRFKDHPATLTELKFKKLEYQTASNTKEVFDLEKDQFVDENDAQIVNRMLDGITPYSKGIFANLDHFISKPKKTQPKNEAELNSEKLAAVERVLNITDNNGAGNRCLTLSAATILLKKHGGDLQAAAAEYKIPIDPKVGETSQTTLSNGLIELAARTIESDDRFITPDTKDNENQLFSNIVACLTAAKQNIADPNNRVAVAKQYADLIRHSGEMLDASIFDALSIRGIPFITLVPTPAQDDLILGSVSGTISFDSEERSVEKYDLTTICFVVRNGLHYKAVVMSDTPNAAQMEKLRLIIKNDMNKTLGQIQNLITDQTRTSAQKSVEFNNLATYVVTKYPFDTKPRIIQMLRDARRTIDDDLISAENNIFIEGASLAFLSNPGPKIQVVE